MILFTSLAVSMAAASQVADEIYPSKWGMVIVAVVAVAFCVAGAVILSFYNEKKIMKSIAKKEDEAFLRAAEADEKSKK